MASAAQLEQEKNARKLRELFRGRFSDDEARIIIAEKGGLDGAVDFVLNGDSAEIRQFILQRNEDLIEALHHDSAQVLTSLTEGIPYTLRLFGCQPCNHSWWRKVPARKEVSKCKICRVRYDPVPRDKEWGLGEYSCECGHSFKSWGQMDVSSMCFKCRSPNTYPKRILPPNPSHRPARHLPHTCGAEGCYNQHQSDDRGFASGRRRNTGRRGRGRGNYGLRYPERYDEPLLGEQRTAGHHHMEHELVRARRNGMRDRSSDEDDGVAEAGDLEPYRPGHDIAGNGDLIAQDDLVIEQDAHVLQEDDAIESHTDIEQEDDTEPHAGILQGDDAEPHGDPHIIKNEHHCVHPLSTHRRVHYPSRPHASSGSTVNTFMTQEFLDEQFELMSLPSISEDN